MVFVIDKSLIIIMLVYCVSFGVLTAQYIYADVFNVTLRDINGNPMITPIQSLINLNSLNALSKQVLNQNSTNTGIDYAVFAATAGYNLIILISGTYIFQLLYLVGAPVIFVTMLLIPYLLLLVRSIMGWIRGI